MYNVISFGAATVDIFIKSSGFVLKRDELCIKSSNKFETSASLICSGGGATNSAVSLSKLGLQTASVSLLGNDPLSLYIFNDLQGEGASPDMLIHRDHEKTDYSVIIVGEDGGRSIITNRGNSRLEVSDINWKNIIHTDWFYITSLEGNLDLLEQLIGFALENHIKIALNPGNRELQNSRRLHPLLKHVNFLLLNGTESEILTGKEVNSDTYWEKLLSFGSEITAVTNGRQGAYVLTASEKLYSPIINTTPVDETGAGDAFGSAFVAGILNHLNMSDSLFWGIKNSASVVSKLGAKPGLLTLSEIEKKL